MDLAAMLTCVTVVTLYETLGRESIEHIMNQTKVQAIACAADKVPSLALTKKNGALPHLRTIVYFDSLKEGDQEAADEVGL